jgi:hypothetical protein
MNDTERNDLLATWPLAEVVTAYLPLEPLICIVGSYKGKLAEFLTEQAHPLNIVCFDPQEWANKEAQQRLSNYPEALVMGYGLGVENAAVPLHHFGTDACSMVFTGNDAPTQLVQAGPVHEGISELINTQYDLGIINIEGYEFTLLPYIMEKLAIENHFKKLAVQFHTDYATMSAYGLLLHELDRAYPHNLGHFLPSWGYWYV